MGARLHVTLLLVRGCVAGLAGVVLAAQAQTPPSPSQGIAFTSTRIGAPDASWMPRQVEVFATSAMYVGHADRAAVYRVDGRKQLMAELNQGGLPPEPERAMAIVRQRIKALGPEFDRRLQAALTAVEKTMVYGVQRLPAVIFDGRRVVYGVADVEQAAEIVRRGGGQTIGARFVPGRRSSTLTYEPPAGTRAGMKPGADNKASGRSNP
jgi:integrating conjugative element protein (TIGR03757 family)